MLVVDDEPSIARHATRVLSRAGFEVVQKALVAGVPAIAAVGAASTLAVDLASRSGMALIGFLRGARFVRYT